ncbi:MAG: 2OG-Fe(II) oxygenase [Bdellovibrio sp.]
MIANFKRYIDELVEVGHFVSDDFIEHELAKELLKVAKQMKANNLFKPAKIGKGFTHQRQENIRGDLTAWVDEKDSKAIARYREHILNFSREINRDLFLNLKSFECHFSFYPIGTFYKKHMDQFQGTSTRQLSCILYLNESYHEADGGELIIYDKKDPNKIEKIIRPQFNRFSCFLTESLPHEVKICHKERFALTGWVRND